MKSLFYKPIKVKHPSEDILFWGCLHYNHDPKWEIPLWKTRGHNSVEEHDKAIITNWNSKASDNTVAFWLGDTCFGRDSEINLKRLFREMKFKTLYILGGNHTAGFKQAIESCDGNILTVGEKTVVFCPNYFEAFINGKSVCISHYPILSFNGMAGGSYMLYSHCHGNLSKSQLGRMYEESGCRALEMSVEKWPFPPTFVEISNLLNKREKVTFDHHSPSTNNPF